MRLTVALSLAGHALLLAALILMAGKIVPLPSPPLRPPITVAFGPALPAATPAAVLPPRDVPPLAATATAAPLPPPQAAPMVAAAEVPVLPPEQVEQAHDLPPPPIPLAKPQPPAPLRREAAQRPPPPEERPQPRSPPPAAPQVASLPPASAPPPAAISGGYRAALAAWFERHKRYPEAARQRGEEGRVVLRFTVDRDGRVLAHEVVESSGHPDLDRAVDDMMRDARLPPFPATMAERQVEVSITLRFALAQ